MDKIQIVPIGSVPELKEAKARADASGIQHFAGKFTNGSLFILDKKDNPKKVTAEELASDWGVTVIDINRAIEDYVSIAEYRPTTLENGSAEPESEEIAAKPAVAAPHLAPVSESHGEQANIPFATKKLLKAIYEQNEKIIRQQDEILALIKEKK